MLFKLCMFQGPALVLEPAIKLSVSPKKQYHSVTNLPRKNKEIIFQLIKKVFHTVSTSQVELELFWTLDYIIVFQVITQLTMEHINPCYGMSLQKNVDVSGIPLLKVQCGEFSCTE